MKIVLFDTDIGADSDDAVALGYLLGKEREQECLLPLVTLSTVRRGAAATVRAIAADYGKEPEVGRMATPLPCDSFDHYASKVAAAFRTRDDAGNAVDCWRALYRSDIEEIIPVIVGPLTNLAEFLRAEPALFAEKTKHVHLMAGRFDEPTPEYNAEQDAAATDYVARNLPCEGIILPYETGRRVLTGRTYFGRRERPIGMCLELVARAFGVNDDEKMLRESWDPLTAVSVFHPEFFQKERGSLETDGKGIVRLLPKKGGNFVVLKDVDREKAEAEIERTLALL